MSYCPQFWGSRAIYIFWQVWPKSHRFCFLWPFSWAIAHSFGVPGRLTCLRSKTKKSLFLRFMAVLMSYCPHFRCYSAICTPKKTQYVFERHDQKLVVFAFYACFHELLPIVLGFQGDFHVWEVRQKIVVFAVYGRFHEVLPTVLASRVIHMFQSYEQKLMVLRFMAVLMSYCP